MRKSLLDYYLRKRDTLSEMTVKVNAIVPEETREKIRSIATEQETSVQAVVALSVTLGLRSIQDMERGALRRKLGKDGRRK